MLLLPLVCLPAADEPEGELDDEDEVPEPEELLELVDCAAGSVDVTTAEVGEAVKVAVPSSTVI